MQNVSILSKFSFAYLYKMQLLSASIRCRNWTGKMCSSLQKETCFPRGLHEPMDGGSVGKKTLPDTLYSKNIKAKMAPVEMQREKKTVNIFTKQLHLSAEFIYAKRKAFYHTAPSRVQILSG